MLIQSPHQTRTHNDHQFGFAGLEFLAGEQRAQNGQISQEGDFVDRRARFFLEQTGHGKGLPILELQRALTAPGCDPGDGGPSRDGQHRIIQSTHFRFDLDGDRLTPHYVGGEPQHDAELFELNVGVPVPIGYRIGKFAPHQKRGILTAHGHQGGTREQPGQSLALEDAQDRQQVIVQPVGQDLEGRLVRGSQDGVSGEGGCFGVEALPRRIQGLFPDPAHGSGGSTARKDRNLPVLVEQEAEPQLLDT